MGLASIYNGTLWALSSIIFLPFSIYFYYFLLCTDHQLIPNLLGRHFFSKRALYHLYLAYIHSFIENLKSMNYGSLSGAHCGIRTNEQRSKILSPNLRVLPVSWMRYTKRLSHGRGRSLHCSVLMHCIIPPSQEDQHAILAVQDKVLFISQLVYSWIDYNNTLINKVHLTTVLYE